MENNIVKLDSRMALYPCEVCGRATVLYLECRAVTGEILWQVHAHDGCLEELAKKHPEYFIFKP